MFLVDTNVISEARKGIKANPGVVQFFRSTQAAERYLSVQTLGEVRRGIENIRARGDHTQAVRLETWVTRVMEEYADRALAFDTDCAQVWGRLMSPYAVHPIDMQIAAIALIHGLEVVTRNVQDFSNTGAKVLNPFR